MTKVIISSWIKDGYFNKINEIEKKFKQIQELCKNNQSNPPILEHNVSSYGEEYRIYVDADIVHLVDGIFEYDFDNNDEFDNLEW